MKTGIWKSSFKFYFDLYTTLPTLMYIMCLHFIQERYKIFFFFGLLLYKVKSHRLALDVKNILRKGQNKNIILRNYFTGLFNLVTQKINILLFRYVMYMF